MTKKLPTLPTMKDHNWMETARQNAEAEVWEEVAKLKKEISDELHYNKLTEQGGAGILAPPVKPTLTEMLKAASKALTKPMMEPIKEWTGEYAPLWPKYLAIFEMEWTGLDQMLKYARRYFPAPKFKKWAERVREHLANEAS